MGRVVCAGCGHRVDKAARLCPYCGADPRRAETGGAQGTAPKQAHPPNGSKAKGILEFARKRQEIVIALGVLAMILLLAGIDHFLERNHPNGAVPLTAVSDFNLDARSEPPMPDLQFQYDGHPGAARISIEEPGAVAPAGGQ